MPDLPILDYLARSVSLFYGIHGVLILYISFNLIHNLPILKLMCYLGFIFGIAIIFIDFAAPMPLYWAFMEGPFILTLNLAVYALVIMIEKEK